MTKFSVIAREEAESSLRLKGFARLKNACSQAYMKKILGKCSHCKAAVHGDIINMVRYFEVDRQAVLIGNLRNDEGVDSIMRYMKFRRVERQTEKGRLTNGKTDEKG